MTYYDQNALKLCHAFWRERLRPGMTCVDATAGRGRGCRGAVPSDRRNGAPVRL